MDIIVPKTTQGEWFVEMSDLTIRCKNFKDSDLMADYKGNIVADLKPSLGITEFDVENGILTEENRFSYLNGFGGRQHAWEEVLANAESICNAVNAARTIKSQKELTQ